jgi:hypothetical protein
MSRIVSYINMLSSQTYRCQKQHKPSTRSGLWKKISVFFVFHLVKRLSRADLHHRSYVNYIGSLQVFLCTLFSKHLFRKLHLVTAAGVKTLCPRWTIIHKCGTEMYHHDPDSERTNTSVGNKTKLHGLSPRANYTDRATAACRRSDCQLVRIEGATWSAWRMPPGVFSIF